VLRRSKLLWSLSWFALSVCVGLLVALRAFDVLFVGGGVLFLALLFVSSPLAVFGMMLILAPLRALVATESGLQLPIDIGLVLFVVAIFVWLLFRILQNRSVLLIQWTKLYIPILGFLFWSGMTLWSSGSVGLWLSEWLKWLIVLVVIVIVMQMSKSLSWAWFVFLLVCAGVSNALVGLYIFFGGSGADHLLINNRFFRAFGTFGQPNPFGGFMGLLLPLSVMMALAYLIVIVRIWLQKRDIHLQSVGLFVFYAFASLVLFAGLLASWSRGAWLGFVFSIAVVAFALPRRLWQSFIFSGSVVVLVGVFWFGGLLPAPVMQRVASSVDDFFVFADVQGVDITSANFAVVERLAHWQAALNMLRDVPWAGVGFGNYEIAYSNYRLINWDEALGHAHNYYLNILAETGMIGFFAYLGVWSVIAWMTWRSKKHPDLLARLLSVGLLGSWAYFSFHNLLDNLYVNNLFLHLGVMLGILVVIHNQVSHSFVIRDYLE